jgi:cytochrome P450
MLDFDPHSKRLQDDPYPVYQRMRDEHPVLHVPELGFWAVSRYEDVKSMLRRPDCFSSMRSLDPNDAMAKVPMIVVMDPPRHDALRSLLNRAFNPHRVAKLEPRIRSITSGLVDDFIERGHCDLWRDLSAALPTIVIAELLGVPSSDREMFKERSTAMASRVGPAMDPEMMADAAHPVMELAGYLASVFDEKRAKPADDLISALLAAEVDGQRLDQGELIGFALLLLIAGNETTTNLISNGAVLLDEHPDQRTRLLEDPSRIPLAVEECLRFESPVQGLERLVTEDIEVGSQKLRRGDKVFLMLGAANRDERSIEEPTRFDVCREKNPHLGFGFGPTSAWGRAWRGWKPGSPSRRSCCGWATTGFPGRRSGSTRERFGACSRYRSSSRPATRLVRSAKAPQASAPCGPAPGIEHRPGHPLEPGRSQHPRAHL